jgi:gliding motility-associated-like protein
MVMRFSPVQLVPQVSGGTLTAFKWSPTQFLSCSNCLIPVAAPQYSMTYNVVGRNEYSCTDTAYAVVKTFTGGQINMPNAFTPDGDGLNDVYYVLAGRDVVQVNNFAIFNRWGQQVFAVQNVPPNTPVHGWNGEVNGQKAASENFVWVLTVTLADGKKISTKGMVLLVR